MTEHSAHDAHFSTRAMRHLRPDPVPREDLEYLVEAATMAPSAGNRALAEALSEVNVDLGRGPMKIWDPLRRGAADIAFVAPYTDALAGLGALGTGGHTPNETLELSSMALAIKRAAILMLRLAERHAEATASIDASSDN